MISARWFLCLFAALLINACQPVEEKEKLSVSEYDVIDSLMQAKAWDKALDELKQQNINPLYSVRKAEVWQNLGQQDSAYKYFQNVIGSQDTSKAVKVAQGKSWHLLTRYHFGRRDIAAMQEAAWNAVQLRRGYLGSRAKETGDSYHNLATSFAAVGMNDSAMKYFDSTLVIRRSQPDTLTLSLANYYNNLAKIVGSFGVREQKWEYLKRAMNILRQLPEEDDNILLTKAACLGNLARESYFRGDPQQSLDFRQDAIDAMAKMSEMPVLVQANNYQGLASTLDALEAHSEALNARKAALSLFEKQLESDQKEIWDARFSMGISFGHLGEWDSAYSFYIPVLKWREARQENLAPEVMVTTYTNIGTTYAKLGKKDSALYFWNKALTISDANEDVKILSPSIRLNISDMLMQEGKVLEAKPLIEQGIANFEDLGIQKHKDLSRLYKLLGYVHWEENRDSDTLKTGNSLVFDAFKKAMMAVAHDRDERKWPPGIGHAFYPKLMLDAYVGEMRYSYDRGKRGLVATGIDEVKTLFERALKWVDTLQTQMRHPEDQSRILDEYIFIWEAYLDLLDMKAGDISEKKQEVLMVMEHAKTSLLRDILLQNENLHYAGVPDSIVDRIAMLNREKRWLEANLIDEDEKKQTTLESELAEKQIEYQQLINKVKSEYSDFHRLRFKSLQVGEDSLNLAPKTVLIHYFVGKENIYQLILGEGLDAFEKLDLQRKPEELGKDVAKLQIALQQNQVSEFAQISHRLFNELSLPSEEDLDGKSVLIIPDAFLHHLDFSMLLSDTSQTSDFSQLQYWGLGQPISYALSAYPLEIRKHSSSKKALALAPGFEEDVKMAYSSSLPAPLSPDSNFLSVLRQPWAMRTAEQLRNMFSAEVLTGLQATESAFYQKAPEAGMLHLGTHAFLSNKYPLRTHLMLAKQGEDTTEQSDGYLHAYELFNLELNADLAVLTACETGLGDFRRGEGVLSLAHAFQYAGCPSTVMSLWPIDEKESQQLIQLFYQKLKEGQNKSQALFEAKKLYLKDAPPELHNPIYWSGLVMMGDTSPIPELVSETYSIEMILGILVFGIVLSFLAWRFYVSRSSQRHG